MSIEEKNQALVNARTVLSASKAYERLTALFDDGVFTEIDAFAKSSEGYAEVAAGHGFVEGMGVYAFAQNADMAGGAMSKAQAAKICKVYELALKTGEPVVAVYDSIGGRLAEGSDLLAAYGTVLKTANNLSGVVPQIAVVVGKCFGTQALIAACADVVIMCEKAELSIRTSGAEASAAKNAEKGVAHMVAKDEAEAFAKAKELLAVLPSNNLSSACVAYDSIDAEKPAEDGMTAKEAAAAVCDADSAVELQADFGKGARTLIATINGTTVGVTALEGKTLDGQDCAKAARFVRFCDAFSMPVITFINAESFSCIKAAAKLTSAYAEATTAKISVITGDAFGAVYIAAAGTGAAADMTFAWTKASVAALPPEAAAVMMLGDDFGGKLKGSVNPQADKAALIAAFKEENLTAMKAAEDGYVDEILTAGETRARLIAALDMLGNKRVTTLPKKHNNLYI